MSKRILVTGATGLIGRSIVELLVAGGWEVTGFDRSLDSRLLAIPDPVREAVSWMEGDTRDLTKVLQATSGAQVIVHLAAGASFLMYEEDPLDNAAGAICGFHNILEAALRNDVKKIVYASTSAVYEGNPVPYREDMVLRPPDLKAFAKKVNEEMADLYAERYQIQTLALRPFSVYGEHEVSKRKYANVVSLFAWAMLSGQRPVIWGDGTQTRDFTHMSDVAHAFVLAVESDTPVRQLNVGTGIETSFNDLVQLLGHKLGVRPSPIYVPAPIAIYAQRLQADPTRSRMVLGFEPQVSLDAGLDRVLARGRTLLTSGAWSDLDQAQKLVLRERGVEIADIG